jgi:hypothetical protein
MNLARSRRSNLVAVASAVAIAGGAGFGVAGAAGHSGRDVSPWTTSHGIAVMADATGAERVNPQPFVIIKTKDAASTTLYQV